MAGFGIRPATPGKSVTRTARAAPAMPHPLVTRSRIPGRPLTLARLMACRNDCRAVSDDCESTEELEAAPKLTGLFAQLHVLVSVSVPLLKSIYFLKASISTSVGGTNISGTVTLGTWGYCVDGTCTSAKLGYSLGTSTITVPRVCASRVYDSSLPTDVAQLFGVNGKIAGISTSVLKWVRPASPPPSRSALTHYLGADYIPAHTTPHCCRLQRHQCCPRPPRAYAWLRRDSLHDLLRLIRRNVLAPRLHLRHCRLRNCQVEDPEQRGWR